MTKAALPRRAIALAISTCVGLVAASCAGGKVAECNQLIETVNTAVTEIETLSTSEEGDDVTMLQQMSDVAEKAVTDIQSLELTDETLQGYQTRFATLYQQYTDASRELITAGDSNNLEGMNTALTTIESTSTQENQLISETNDYCQN